MMFALVATDQPNCVARRKALRPEHLKHLEALGDRLVLAGPFLDDAGESVGSIVIIEADDLAQAREMLGRDPFVRDGLFDTISIKPWKVTINNSR
jgi:hypothetical protein